MPAQPTWQKVLLGDKSRPSGRKFLLTRAVILAFVSVAVVVGGLTQGTWQWLIGVICFVIAATVTAWALYWWDSQA